MVTGNMDQAVELRQTNAELHAGMGNAGKLVEKAKSLLMGSEPDDL